MAAPQPRSQNFTFVRFLMYFLGSPAQQTWINVDSSGMTSPALTKAKIEELLVPPPPIDEQRRVVARIEEMLERSQRANGALNEANTDLEDLMTASIASIFEAPVSASFEHLAAALAQYLRADKKAEPDLTCLPSLADGWEWRTLGRLGQPGEPAVLTGPFGTNLKGIDFVAQGISVLTIGCLTEAGIKLDKAQYISQDKARELQRYSLRSGDLLFSRMASVGRAGLVTDQFAGMIFNYHMMRLRLNTEQLLPELFVAYVKASRVVSEYLRQVNHGARRHQHGTTASVASHGAATSTSAATGRSYSGSGRFRARSRTYYNHDASKLKQHGPVHSIGSL